MERDLSENRGVTPRHGLVPIRLIPLLCRSVQDDPSNGYGPRPRVTLECVLSDVKESHGDYCSLQAETSVLERSGRCHPCELPSVETGYVVTASEVGRSTGR